MTNLSRSLMPAALCVSVFLLAACERTTLPTVPIPLEQDPARIEITPSVLNLTSIDLTQKLSAEVFDVDDEVISYAVVSWSSGDTAVAAVSPQGDVVAKKLGVAQITARYKDVSASVDVTVTQVIGSIEIHPIVLTLSVGSSTSYHSIVNDQTFSVIPNAAVVWTVSDPSVAEVVPRLDGSAWVTAIGIGTTQITVTYGDKSATATLTVQ